MKEFEKDPQPLKSSKDRRAAPEAAPGDHLQYLLTAYLFDGLSAEGKQEVEEHLQACAECRAELESLHRASELIAGALKDEKSPYAFEERRRERILQAASKRRRGLWLLRPNRPLFWLAAAAALLIALVPFFTPTLLRGRKEMFTASSTGYDDSYLAKGGAAQVVRAGTEVASGDVDGDVAGEVAGSFESTVVTDARGQKGAEPASRLSGKPGGGGGLRLEAGKVVEMAPRDVQGAVKFNDYASPAQQAEQVAAGITALSTAPAKPAAPAAAPARPSAGAAARTGGRARRDSPASLALNELEKSPPAAPAPAEPPAAEREGLEREGRTAALSKETAGEAAGAAVAQGRAQTWARENQSRRELGEKRKAAMKEAKKDEALAKKDDDALKRPRPKGEATVILRREEEALAKAGEEAPALEPANKPGSTALADKKAEVALGDKPELGRLFLHQESSKQARDADRNGLSNTQHLAERLGEIARGERGTGYPIIDQNVVDNLDVSGWQFNLGYPQIQIQEGAQYKFGDQNADQTADRQQADLPPIVQQAVAESLLTSYTNYRALDPALSWGSFLKRPLLIPPPQVGDEGLGEAEFRRRYGTNPFVDTRRDHLSTFALDVDTASFTLAKNHLQNGQLPPPRAIRVEEFVNSLPQDYQPDPEEVFSVFCDGMPSVFGPSGVELLRIGIKARELRPGERRPAVLTFAIDVSGSMAESARLEIVKRALEVLVGSLASSDQVAIIGFAGQASLVLPHTQARHRDRILGALQSLAPLGGTNVEAGLELAYRVASDALSPGSLHRVLLLSDGAANIGARGPEEILKKVGVFAKRGIYLSTVGIGMGRYNDQMLERLANEGNGNYSYVGTVEDAVRIFSQNLPSLSEVLAEDAKIQVDFNPETVAHYRLLGYENRDIRDEDFRNDRVDAGEVGPGTTVTALYEIARRPAAAGPLGKVFLRFRDAATRQIVERDYPIPEGVVARRAGEAGPPLRLLAAAAELAELLRGSYYARNGSFGQVIAQLLGLDEAARSRPEWQELYAMALQAQQVKIQRLQEELAGANRQEAKER